MRFPESPTDITFCQNIQHVYVNTCVVSLNCLMWWLIARSLNLYLLYKSKFIARSIIPTSSTRYQFEAIVSAIIKTSDTRHTSLKNTYVAFWVLASRVARQSHACSSWLYDHLAHRHPACLTGRTYWILVEKVIARTLCNQNIIVCLPFLAYCNLEETTTIR